MPFGLAGGLAAFGQSPIGIGPRSGAGSQSRWGEAGKILGVTIGVSIAIRALAEIVISMVDEKIRAEEALRTSIKLQAELLAKEMRRAVTQMGAVDTGKLRDSIGVTAVFAAGPQGRMASYLVGPSADYAEIVEYGTSTTPPRPFMRVAIKRTEKKIARFSVMKFKQVFGGVAVSHH